MKRNIIYRSRLAIVAVAVLVSSALIVRAQSTSTDPLKSYTTCKVTGDLKIKEVTRRTAKDNYREVTTDSGKQKVSVVDGYRVMFAYPDLMYYFANVKIEQSAPDSYAADKEVLVNQLKHYSAIKEAHPMIFADKIMLNGSEHYGIDRDKIDVGDQVGVHLLFYDPAHLVVTVYFLNQSKSVFHNNRRYEDIKQYRELRDDFLNSYSECLKRVADAQL
ncbi:MAG TPA: hypothetical protein VLB68_14695 [Pyrinomonadaceae bacterium]|nr:hypothetical protein [Pyrinomonadaceae bacterium]